jgi:hypothetical protein
MFEVRIHSHLAIRSLECPALNLWYLCRGKDEEGSGWAIITKADLDSFGKCRTTTWRWLNNRDLFIRYSLDRSSGTYKVYYRSVITVCNHFEVNLGAVGFTDTITDLAAQAANIEAIKLQQNSLWLANKDLRELSTYFSQEFDLSKQQVRQFIERNKIVKPDKYFTTNGIPLSDISAGSQVKSGRIDDFFYYNKRQVALLWDKTITYGASLTTIASNLQISYATAQRLLVTAPRLQIAYSISWDQYWLYKQEQQEGIDKSPFVSVKKGKPFQMGTYRYYSLYKLCSQKRLRNKINFNSKSDSISYNFPIASRPINLSQFSLPLESK